MAPVGLPFARAVRVRTGVAQAAIPTHVPKTLTVVTGHPEAAIAHQAAHTVAVPTVLRHQEVAVVHLVVVVVTQDAEDKKALNCTHC